MYYLSIFSCILPFTQPIRRSSCRNEDEKQECGQNVGEMFRER